MKGEVAGSWRAGEGSWDPGSDRRTPPPLDYQVGNLASGTTGHG